MHGPGGFVLGGVEGNPGTFEKVQGRADADHGNHISDDWLMKFAGETADNFGGIH